jgi:ABC-type polysaccharide/polyol phosphate transport system ATPase subunit
MTLPTCYSERVVTVADLSKRYKIYPGVVAKIKDLLLPGGVPRYQEFWALRDIAFQMGQGECLGIIGANGSGKSTLLRILCGISKPTTGGYMIHGRVASLLDLGLGFHQELSGRQNVLLNAGFLGLEKKEIEGRIDEMIQFAELGEFIDLPIRTYSTGMFVRLGFAAAAGVDPDVLIIDEVLSVGDAYFQRKSLDKVERFKKLGKCILIVSHSMPVIQRFCERTLWLHEGRIKMFAETSQVTREYELFSWESYSRKFGDGDRGDLPGSSSTPINKDSGSAGTIGTRWGSGEIVITKVEMIGEDGNARWQFATGEKVKLRMTCCAPRPVKSPVFAMMVHSIEGFLLFATANYEVDPFDFGTIDGERCIEYVLDSLNLNRGSYFLSVGAFLEPDYPFWDKPADFHNQSHEFKIWSDTLEHGYLHMTGEWGFGS